MKKILFGIIAFLGIGLSFCSADEYVTWSVLDENSVYDSSFNLLSTGYFASIPQYFGGSCKTNSGFYFSILSFTGFSNSVYLSDLCYIKNRFSISDLGIVGYINGVVYPLFETGNYWCFDLGDSFDLSIYNYSINLQLIDSSSRSCLTYFNYGSNSFFKFKMSLYGNYYFGLGDSRYFNFSLPNANAINNSFFSYLGKFSLLIPSSNPKLKVNYGNTSYEYEIDGSNDVEIHLKSPVVMSGSYNYVYDGPIGINLFYNNTSQFYDKDKLYLKSMYWYNKNIFTPICL